MSGVSKCTASRAVRRFSVALASLVPYVRMPQDDEINSQIRTRNIVERQIGVWKHRFSELSMGLRMSLNTTQAVYVLYNYIVQLMSSENLIFLFSECSVRK